MTARKKRLKPGDLLRVTLDDSAAHLHYLGKHPEYGDVVRVLESESLPEALSDREAVLSAGYVAFYPVVAAVSQGLVTVVGHHDATLEMPMKLRRPGARAKDGTVLAWLIEQDGQESLTKALTAEERALPIAVIWNHEMLCTRLREGWRPEKEGA
jgi:hypothetical protein